MANPYLVFFPYLSIQGQYTIGPWDLPPLSEFSGPWLSSKFEDLSKTFIGAFRDANGNAFSNTYVLVHGKRGMDGNRPTRLAIGAIQSAINFSVLDRNPRPGSDNAGMMTSTTDNTELFIWPIDTIGGYVALGRGSIVPVVDGGHQMTDSLRVAAPLELHMPWGPRIDQDLLTSMYQLGTRRFGAADDLTRKRVEVAIRWLSQSWRNSPSIRMTDRVIFLKTGFEALSGGLSDSWACAKWLRQLHEQDLGGQTALNLEHMLWSTKEKERHAVTFRKKVHNITDLQHWFMAFAGARNLIIHQGITPKLTYRQRGSRYNGLLPYTAERLLRESIKVSMASLGYPDLWRPELNRTIAKAVMAGGWK